MRLLLIKIGLLSVFCLILNTKNLQADEILKNTIIKNNKTISGRVIIEGKVTVEKGAVLYIQPGTQILFKNLDTDGDGISETSLWIYGNIIAKGEKGRKILFTSYEKEKKWGDWKEIQINHVKGFVFDYVEIQYSEYGLHIHFSEGEITNSIFRYNNDCTRLGNSKISFKDNLFEKNTGKALNFTNCNILFERNVVRENREGIFVFEKSGFVTIRENNIYNNFKNIKTGDFFKDKLVLERNFIYPANNIEGEVRFVAVNEPFYGILPDDKDAYINFIIETQGYVDGGGVIDGERLYFPSFDGNIYEYDLKNGYVRKFFIDDFSDAVPVLYGKKLFSQNWRGDIVTFDLLTGNKKIIASFDKTLKDDHRNPSPVVFDNKGVFLSPGGSLLVINLTDNKELFRTKLNGEFRAKPLLNGDLLYIPSVTGDIYTLSFIDYSLNKVSFDGSFYSSPVFYEDSIVILSKEGKVFFLDKNLIVKRVVDLKSSFRYQSPIVFNESLYLFSLDGKIFKLKQNGEPVLLKETEEIFTSTPILYKGFIVIPGFYGNLYFYRDDKTIRISNLGEMQFSPLVYDDFIIIGSRANRVYGIKIW
ncbi:MAG: right-handed parallel beta-helix repeat-containing protein [Proteobacteria bacterium]|nr:right-handed parallel beta-helix repeat-containing protein [Pseudomonadota bacterium]